MEVGWEMDILCVKSNTRYFIDITHEVTFVIITFWMRKLALRNNFPTVLFLMMAEKLL